MKNIILVAVLLFASNVFGEQYDPAPGDRMHIQYTGTIALTDAKVIAATRNFDAQKKTLALNTAGTQCR